ncbi:MAG: DUF2339 domain-containing protein [Pseudomonadota bacterium]
MEAFVFLAFAIAALIIVGALLGIIAFFKQRSLRDSNAALQRAVAELTAKVETLYTQLSTATKSVEEPSHALESDEVEPEETEDATPSAATPPPLPPISATPPEPPKAEPSKPERKLDTESTIGGKLTIWVGGFTLALGGLFLALYAIENAILGPTERVLLGFGFGALLAAGGEWARRRPGIFALPGFEKANIPATLTAGGIFAMFGAVYAAHALYDLLGPVLAFIVLAALALATLALALIHGPGLAAIGLLSANVTPFLLNTTSDSISILALYVLAVSVAALAVARLRGWLWLALSAIGAMVLFGGAFAIEAGHDQPYVVDGFIAVAFGLGFATFVLGIGRKAAEMATHHTPKPDWLATGVLSLLALPLLLTFDWRKDMLLEVLEMAVLFGIPLAIAYTYPALRFIVALPAALGVVRYLSLDLPALRVSHKVLEGPSLDAIELAGTVQTFAFIGVIAATALMLAGFWIALRSPARTVVAASTTISAIALYLVAYVRIEQLASSQMFALFGAVLAMLLTSLALQLNARLDEEAPGRDGTVAAGLVGAIVSLAFAASVWLQGPALTIALGLIPLATTLVWQRFPLIALRVFAVLALVPYALRIVWDPLIDRASVVEAPALINALLWGYGIPTLTIAASAYLLTRAKDDVFAQIMQAAAVFFAVATVVALSLHAIDPTFRFTTNEQALMGTATLVLIGGAFALALTRIGATPRFAKLRLAADILGIGGMLVGAAGLFVFYNPVLGRSLDPVEVGQGLLFNRLAYAYLLPLILFAAVIWQGWNSKSRWYICTATVFMALLCFAWVNLSIRQTFNRNILTKLPVEQTELYTYSVVWLLIGLALLGAGIILRNLKLRAASGLVIVAVVLKVFLLDLAELEGVLRALSFIGLGLVLMGIGFVYQRALRRTPTPAGKEGFTKREENGKPSADQRGTP